MARPIDIIEAIYRNDRETLLRLADESPKALRSFVVADALADDGSPNPAAAEQASVGGQPADRETWLALHFAAQWGRAEIAAELIDRYGVSVDSRTRYRLPTRARRTPLMLAAARGHEDVVEVLLNRSAEVEVRDAASDSPLSLAAAGGHADITRRLLDAGAEIDAPDGQGRTPLHRAILPATPRTHHEAHDASTLTPLSPTHTETAVTLIDAGADVNALCPRDAAGYTPLHRCLQHRPPAISLIDKLLEQGGDPTLADPRLGRSAIDLAADLAQDASCPFPSAAREAFERLRKAADA